MKCVSLEISRVKRSDLWLSSCPCSEEAEAMAVGKQHSIGGSGLYGVAFGNNLL